MTFSLSMWKGNLSEVAGGTGMLAATREIISEVEKLTGLSVEVIPDKDLKTLSKARIARGSDPVHTVIYNPSRCSAPDYQICFQCSFILRLFACSPDERVSFAVSGQGRKELEGLLLARGGIVARMRIAEAQVQELCDMLFNGLMTQLRSTPIGLRVDAWLMGKYPELKELQQEAVRRQLRENSEVLKPGVKDIAPEKVYKANIGINAAFAEFWARAWKQAELTMPYEATGYRKIGSDLLCIWDEIPEAPANDRRLVDAWADRLNLVGWYKWIAFDGGKQSGRNDLV